MPLAQHGTMHQAALQGSHRTVAQDCSVGWEFAPQQVFSQAPDPPQSCGLLVCWGRVVPRQHLWGCERGGLAAAPPLAPPALFSPRASAVSSTAGGLPLGTRRAGPGDL